MKNFLRYVVVVPFVFVGFFLLLGLTGLAIQFAFKWLVLPGIAIWIVIGLIRGNSSNRSAPGG
jgi:hypothetical protein